MPVAFENVLGVDAARHLLGRVVFHYTPEHASWLNMAEIEIGILDRQCLDRRSPTRPLLAALAGGSRGEQPGNGRATGVQHAVRRIHREAAPVHNGQHPPFAAATESSAQRPLARRPAAGDPTPPPGTRPT